MPLHGPTKFQAAATNGLLGLINLLVAAADDLKWAQ
jgi:hypothetical protein